VARREYKGAAPETELASGISDVSSAFNVVGGGGAGYPTGAVGNFFVVIDPETANEEKILCTSRATDAFSCAGGRGADDTIAVSHASGAKVRHVFTKTDADEANAHVNATTGVHGRTSALMSVDDAQTGTNKTFSGANNTFTAIPQSAITNLVADLAAKLAVAAVHDTWEAIIAAAPGANWQAALAAGLDADSATVLGAMGTGWPAILGVAPGSGWGNALDTALGSNWETALAATLAGDWTNVLDSPINGGWLNQFAAEPGNIVRRIATAYFQNTVGPITTTETQVLNITAATITGRTYRVKATMPIDISVVTDGYFCRIREDSVSGAEVQGRRIGVPNAGLTAYDATIEGEYTADANENKVFSVTIVRTSGTGQLNRTGSSVAPAIIYVEHVW
jgi:hypothetical protein